MCGLNYVKNSFLKVKKFPMLQLFSKYKPNTEHFNVVTQHIFLQFYQTIRFNCTCKMNKTTRNYT